MGRPSDYTPEMNEQAYKLCLLGATDAQLADFFEVSESTVNKWKLDHPEFSESVKSGKTDADANVSKSLYHRALGYTHPEEKIFCQEGQIIRAETVKQYPPDTVAAIFWLKNRQKEHWRDKQEMEVTGNLQTMSDEELMAKLAVLREKVK